MCPKPVLILYVRCPLLFSILVCVIAKSLYCMLVSSMKLISLLGLPSGYDLLGKHPWSGAGGGSRPTCLLMLALHLPPVGSRVRDLASLGLTLLTWRMGGLFLQEVRKMNESEKIHVKCFVVSTQKHLHKNNKNHRCLYPSCMLNYLWSFHLGERQRHSPQNLLAED